MIKWAMGLGQAHQRIGSLMLFFQALTMQARLHSVFYICLMTYNMTQMTEQKVAQSMQPLSQLARLALLHPVNDLQLPVVIAAPLS